jgi:RNA polymerase sigma-70 factor (ECF subfamily)
VIDPDQSDAVLMADLARGDMAALGTLVERHQEKAMALAYRMLGRWDQAEDAAQDAFLHVHRAAAAWRPEAKFSTWLYRVVVNRCLDMKRRAAREPAEMPQNADALFGDEPPDPVEQSESARLIREAVQSLPPRQRAALILHRYHELSHDQIAQATGSSVSAVESLLVRAYAHLRGRLANLAKG